MSSGGLLPVHVHAIRLLPVRAYAIRCMQDGRMPGRLLPALAHILRHMRLTSNRQNIEMGWLLWTKT